MPDPFDLSSPAPREEHAVSRRRCRYHSGREAAARCVRCRHYFCRECATEHAGTIICAACLGKLSAAGDRRLAATTWLSAAAQLLAGLFLVWACFYLLGRVLLLTPASFHEGSVWSETWWMVDR